MKIKIKKEVKGQDRSELGIPVPVKLYLKDSVYDVGEELGQSLINADFAILADESEEIDQGASDGETKDAPKATGPMNLPGNRKKKHQKISF